MPPTKPPETNPLTRFTDFLDRFFDERSQFAYDLNRLGGPHAEPDSTAQARGEMDGIVGPLLCEAGRALCLFTAASWPDCAQIAELIRAVVALCEAGIVYGVQSAECAQAGRTLAEARDRIAALARGRWRRAAATSGLETLCDLREYGSAAEILDSFGGKASVALGHTLDHGALANLCRKQGIRTLRMDLRRGVPHGRRFSVHIGDFLGWLRKHEPRSTDPTPEQIAIRKVALRRIE
jgi:hypothetical protein